MLERCTDWAHCRHAMWEDLLGATAALSDITFGNLSWLLLGLEMAGGAGGDDAKP